MTREYKITLTDEQLQAVVRDVSYRQDWVETQHRPTASELQPLVAEKLSQIIGTALAEHATAWRIAS
jgi:hypothetical protein